MVKMMVVKGTMMRILVKVMVYVFMMVVIKGEIKEGEAGGLALGWVWGVGEGGAMVRRGRSR